MWPNDPPLWPASPLSVPAECAAGVALFGSFKVAQSIPHPGGFFVILFLDRFVEIVFQLLALAERALAVDLVEPVLEGLDLPALIGKVLTRMMLIKFPQALDAAFDFLNRLSISFLLQLQSSPRAGINH